eukprot:1293837-Prymnesium_polylepis.1
MYCEAYRVNRIGFFSSAGVPAHTAASLSLGAPDPPPMEPQKLPAGFSTQEPNRATHSTHRRHA